MDIRFYTTRLRGPAIAQFVIPVQVEGHQLDLRGEIIDSPRDQCLAVMWPRSKGGFFVVAPSTEGEAHALNRKILEAFAAFQARRPT